MDSNKGAIEISVNAIIFLIIGIAVLGLIIAFTVARFRAAGELITYEAPTPEPDSYSPVQTPGGDQAFTFQKKAKTLMGLKLYNALNKDFDSFWTNTTVMECVGDAGPSIITPEIPLLTVPAGSVGEIGTIFSVNPTMMPGEYACQLSFKSESYYVIGRVGTPEFRQGDPVAQKYIELTIQ